MATHENQRKLLELMSRMGSHGRAEGEKQDVLPRTFWPVAEHLRAFDPDVVLVVGPRGAGKTELFRAVIQQGLLPKVRVRVPDVRFPQLNKTTWLAAYPIESDFPSERLLREYVIKSGSATDELLLDVWLAYLVRTLSKELQDDALGTILKPAGGDVGAVVSAFRAKATEALLALDALDKRLESDGRFVIVAYDELDTLARNDPGLTQAAVRGLVALWAGHTRRWRRLRGKVFLRTDLYDRAATAGGADFAKLASNRAELSWSDLNLYAMLLRRIVNSGDELREYCKAKVDLEDGGELGYFPVLKKPNDARPVIERIVGVYMGANERKGLAYTWLLDHVRDGRGHALPRPLVRLFESAATIQRDSKDQPRWPRLLDPRAARRALDKVSEEHVNSALDEWPWLDGLKGRISSLREVPWERREIERHLEKGMSEPWGSGSRPPVETGRELVDYLIEVGVFRARADKRVDAPDLFLSGLGLVRKGGVKKK